MLEVFIIEDNVVKPTPQILLISPFKEIWERDKSTKKDTARNELAVIEFMVSPLKSNPYKDYAEDLRKERLKEKFDVDFDDELISKGIQLYTEFLYEASFSYQFLISAKEGAMGVKEFITDTRAKLAERTKAGSMLIKPKEITSALRDTEEVLKNLENLEKRVHEEMKKAKTISNREIGHFER
jgi:hypothetical protein